MHQSPAILFHLLFQGSDRLLKGTLVSRIIVPVDKLRLAENGRKAERPKERKEGEGGAGRVTLMA